ncbi:Protein SirB2 [Moritella sp. JT01]|uniref:SirB2 family protein n=1 Tax=Moritella sp. JT01 TaxID=756698 RepID=UPI00079C1BD4|nr:SirB2 family protein [Moritella sp. JT01]KXO11904.1 Protein SirB2 [Moritella sp. JT01]
MDIVIPLHIATLLLSVLMYFLNFAFTIKQSPYLEHTGFIKSRKVIDMITVMMIALVCMVSGQAPFVDTVMTEKLLSTLAITFMVFMSLQQDKNLFFRCFAFAGSIGWLFYVYTLAVNGEAYLLR